MQEYYYNKDHGSIATQQLMIILDNTIYIEHFMTCFNTQRY